MPVNANPDYVAAEAKYHSAQTLQEKVKCLEDMIAKAPKHKSSENLLANLKTRYKKFKSQLETSNKKSSSNKQGIKKFEMQAILIGKSNSGKSSLLKILTNAQPKISEIKFSTTSPEIGMMNYATTQIQIIENPGIDSPEYDKGLASSADTLILIVTSLEEIPEIKKNLPKNKKQIIVFNKIDLLDQNQKRKLEETLKSKKYNYQIISTKTAEGIEELKGKIFQSFERLRIYTKNPNKKQSEKDRPIILNPGSTISDVAEKILKGFSKQVKETRIWGPSSKFPGQQVGMKHQVKDLDIVEFKTR